MNNNNAPYLLATLIVCTGLFGFTMTFIGKVQKDYNENLAVIGDNTKFVGETLGTLKATMSIVEQHDNMMRTMAYHQAIAQMEQEYPEAVRHSIPHQKWQYIVEQRQTQILNDIRDDIRTY